MISCNEKLVFCLTMCQTRKQRSIGMQMDQFEKERKKDILTSFKRPKCPIRPNKRLHLKCFLVFERDRELKEASIHERG